MPDTCEHCATKIYKPCWWAFEAGLNTPITCSDCECWGCGECITRATEETGETAWLCSDCGEARRKAAAREQHEDPHWLESVYENLIGPEGEET